MGTVELTGGMDERLETYLVIIEHRGGSIGLVPLLFACKSETDHVIVFCSYHDNISHACAIIPHL